MSNLISKNWTNIQLLKKIQQLIQSEENMKASLNVTKKKMKNYCWDPGTLWSKYLVPPIIIVQQYKNEAFLFSSGLLCLGSLILLYPFSYWTFFIAGFFIFHFWLCPPIKLFFLEIYLLFFFFYNFNNLIASYNLLSALSSEWNQAYTYSNGLYQVTNLYCLLTVHYFLLNNR